LDDESQQSSSQWVSQSADHGISYVGHISWQPLKSTLTVASADPVDYTLLQ